jgi:3',5'-cyclic AMP phosphodiesterase CpdA
MRTIAHISDLHFGRTDPSVVTGLVEDLAALNLDLIVVSGDLTQRARSSQFSQARAFLDQLPAPYLVVPGNHDVTPVYRPVQRFLNPFASYRQFISGDLAPSFFDDELAVVGVNTAHPHLISEGRISSRQLAEIKLRFASCDNARFRVVVTHHPFIPHPESRRTPLIGRAVRALTTLEACGVDLLLAGHLHHAFTGDASAYHTEITRSILVAQATTTTSTRLRKDSNAYNHITIDGDLVELDVRTWGGDRFESLRVERFRRAEHRWTRA